jgi:hypothetical protein
MKRNRVVLLAALALAVPAAGVQAQQKAYSVPVSNKIVKLEIQVPEGRWVKAMVQEGGQVRVEDQSLNLTMAFVPILQDGGIRVRAFRVENRGNGNESMHFIENIDTRTGDTGFTKKAAGAFAVKVIEVVVPPE